MSFKAHQAKATVYYISYMTELPACLLANVCMALTSNTFHTGMMRSVNTFLSYRLLNNADSCYSYLAYCWINGFNNYPFMHAALLNNKVIPPPAEGVSNETYSYINCSDEKYASFLFEKASRRLLDINNWGNLTDKLCADFVLTDNKGNLVADEAKEGYRIRINIPGPGTKTGRGYDWVRIEKIKLEDAVNEEYVAIKVRPASNPEKTSWRIAHFFRAHATSTFMVKRKGLQITCCVTGRNEKPNTKQKTFLEALRNFLTAILAFFGFSKLQWKCLTKAILSYSNKEKEMVR